MKKFWIDILFTIICFCSTWIVGEYVFDRYKGDNVHSYKYKSVKDNQGIKTLLIGHSSFENSLNPYLLGDSVYDFAMCHRSWLYWDVRLLEDLMPTLPNLKTVMFTLTYTVPYNSPHYNKIEGALKDHLYYYSRYMHIPYDQFPQNYIYSSALIANKMGLRYWKDENTIDPLGYFSLEGRLPIFESFSTDIPDIETNESARKSYDEYREYLVEIAKLCYEQNVRFIIVTNPCADSFVEKTTKKGIDNLYALVDSVRIHYPVEYINYMSDEEFRSDSLYYDFAHINSVGADMFAKRVKNDFGL